jgi:hypothetical protein
VISIRGHRHVFADACGARPLIKSGIDIRVRGAIGPREADDDGFELSVDVDAVRWPERYMDEKRGRVMWDRSSVWSNGVARGG